MKKIGFYGNCQLRVLSNLIKDFDFIENEFEIVSLKQVQKIQDREIDGIIEQIKQLDIIVYQKVKGNHKKSSDYLLSFLKSNCQKICIPSLFFEGYNPELTKIKIDKKPINNPFIGQLHDLFILAYYLKYPNNNCIEAIIDFCNNRNLYSEQFLTEFFHWTLKQLQDRETQNCVDIKISDYITANFDRERLFVDSNHPCPPVYSYIITKIFELLNLPFDCNIDLTLDDLHNAEYGHGHQYIIYPSVIDKFNLGFPEHNNYLFNQNIVSQKDFIQKMLSVYKTIEDRKLREALLANQRFQLLQTYLPFKLEKPTEVYLHSENKLTQLEIEYSTSLKEIAQTYQAQKKWDSLIKCYKKLIALNPEETDIHLKLARLYKQQGAKYKAIAAYQELIETKPNSAAKIYRELGDLLSHKQDNIQEAIEAYQEAASLKQDWQPQFYIKLAELLIKKSQYEQAIEFAKKAIAIKPNASYYHMVLGNALFRLGLLDDAITSYSQAIKVKPDNFNGYKRIGDALLQKNELITASRCYQKVLQLNPQAHGIYRLLGDIFTKQGKWAEAQNYYKKDVKKGRCQNLPNNQ